MIKTFGKAAQVKPGQVFGRLTVLEKYRKRYGKVMVWFCACECSCGNETEVVLLSLTKGVTRSCGCLRNELSGQRKFKHGHHVNYKPSKTYRTWQGLFNRCYNSNEKSFADYGGRGVTVCERWHKFENFLEDMGTRPEGMSIERKNNDGDYNPENCVWADKLTQANNCRSNRIITFQGVTLTLAGWGRKTGIAAGTISVRLNHLKWSVEEALTRKVRRYPK